MMRNQIGPPVEGDDFFGRKQELTYCWQKLEEGSHLIFPSPRRFGKTSFAKYLLVVAKEAEWNVIEINLEKIHSEKDFLEALLEELEKQSWWESVKSKGKTLKERLKSFKPTVTYEEVEISLEWQESKSNIYKELKEILNHGEDTLIFLDELAVLLTNIVKTDNHTRNVEQLLHWLRSFRQVSDSHIRWIFCSSVGIENFAHRHNISETINDLLPYHLRPFSWEESFEMLGKLEASSTLTLGNEVKNALLDKLVYFQPYFLQIMFEKITFLVQVDGLPISINLIEKAYDYILKESYFNTWIERLQEQYGEIEPETSALLKHICQEKSGSKRDNLLDVVMKTYHEVSKAESVLAQALYMLQNDGYVMEHEGLYLFRSPLLRDFWYNRFVK